MLLSLVLVAWLSLPANDDAAGLACAYDSSGVSMRSSLSVEEYPIAARTMRRAIEMLRHPDKPFPFTGAEIGHFQMETELRYTYESSGQETVTKACLHAQYTVHVPSFLNDTIRWCMADVTEQVRWHEMKHYRIAKRIVERTARLLVGLPRSRIDDEMARMNGALANAQRAFHSRPEGQPLTLDMRQLMTCAGE